MPKTRFVLLIALFAILPAVLGAQTSADVTITVALVGNELELKPVPKFGLSISKTNDTTALGQTVSTSFQGIAQVSLPAGEYTVRSVKPVEFNGSSYAWDHAFTVAGGRDLKIELSVDNAKVTEAAPARRVSREGELFQTLRNGVVTIQGELMSGTGFIFDERGLVLTNHRVIAGTNDIRVRFDRYTAVRARVLAADEEKDIAVLQVNLSAFPSAHILKLAGSDAAPPLVVGEHVFTIGSPIHQDKILTSGIVSKIEARAIISDLAVGAGNSGGPLFNSVGEVVGLTTFQVKDKDETGSGIAGIVRIEEAAAVISKARELAAQKGLPSAELMPNVPEGIFPVETIKTAINRKDFPRSEYISDVKDYQVKFMTPVYKFYEIDKDRIESLKNRDGRNADKGVSTADKFRNLHYWREYTGELRPVVEVLALPETTATGKSVMLSITTSALIGIGTPLDHKYKADFYQMKLMCDGTEVTPISRGKIELNRKLQHYYKSKERYTFAGLYSYPFDIFEPGRCREMQLQVFSEEDIETPITTDVNRTIKQRVWTDFEDFRRERAAGPAL